MRIVVNISSQTLHLLNNDKEIKIYSISTAGNGPGEEKNSEKTPRGKHVIRAKIGEGAPINTVFVGRRPTGEIYKPGMRQKNPERDWILTRILWLSGLELGKNRLNNVDTMQRYIYIHGAPDEIEMGTPGSRGCIRMKNTDLLSLFNVVSVGCPIEILE